MPVDPLCKLRCVVDSKVVDRSLPRAHNCGKDSVEVTWEEGQLILLKCLVLYEMSVQGRGLYTK